MKVIRTENAPLPVGPYSQAIKVGDFLFISGQVPVDPNTRKTVDGDIEQQTRQAIENVRTVLAAAGMSLTNVVKVSVFLKDINDFRRMNEIYGAYFRDDPPARTCVQAQLPMSEWLVEMDVVACLP